MWLGGNVCGQAYCQESHSQEYYTSEAWVGFGQAVVLVSYEPGGFSVARDRYGKIWVFDNAFFRRNYKPVNGWRHRSRFLDISYVFRPVDRFGPPLRHAVNFTIHGSSHLDSGYVFTPYVPDCIKK